jgi:hypothetical protein
MVRLAHGGGEAVNGKIQRTEEKPIMVECKRTSINKTTNSEQGFTLIEVAIASIITMVSLAFLASLFTLALSQNRQVRNYSTSLALAQRKLEELNAVERDDTILNIGGGLGKTTSEIVEGYYEVLYVDPTDGNITPVIPEGATPIYNVYWKVEEDPELENTKILSVRVEATQPGYGKTREETTLTSARSW